MAKLIEFDRKFLFWGFSDITVPWGEIPPPIPPIWVETTSSHTCKIQLRMLTQVRNPYMVVRFVQFKGTRIGRPITVEDAKIAKMLCQFY